MNVETATDHPGLPKETPDEDRNRLSHQPSDPDRDRTAALVVLTTDEKGGAPCQRAPPLVPPSRPTQQLNKVQTETTMTWVVLTSGAKMPTSVRSPYRNVALVKLTQEYADKYAAGGELPKMLSARARGVEKIEHLGHHFVGKTAKAAYQSTMAQACLEAGRRNGGNVQ